MITRSKNYLLLVLAVLLSMPAFALDEGGVKSMTLQDCIDYAMQHSDTIKNVRLNIRRQNAQNNQIRAQALPRINVGGQLNYSPNPQQTLVPAGIFDGGQSQGYIPVQFTPGYNSTVSLSGSQPIFDGTLLVALKARNTIMEASRQVAKLTEEGLKHQIQRAYYGVVIAQDQLRIISSSLATARDMSHDQEVLYNTGFAEKIDVDRSHVQLTNLETDSLKIAGLLETGEQGLKFAMGMDINQEIVLVETSLDENLLASAQLLTEQVDYSHRTEYNLLNTSLKLDEAYLRRYKLAAYPTLSLIANAGYNYGSNSFSDLTEFRKNYLFSTLIGLQLNIPIFNGLLRQNQVEEARINIEKTHNNIHQLKLYIDFQTSQSQTTLRNALLAAEKQKRNLELSNTVVDLARRKYKAGVGSNLEVNQAQTDLLLSQNNYYSALLDVVNAQADVQRALGQFQ